MCVQYVQYTVNNTLWMRCSKLTSFSLKLESCYNNNTFLWTIFINWSSLFFRSMMSIGIRMRTWKTRLIITTRVCFISPPTRRTLLAAGFILCGQKTMKKKKMLMRGLYRSRLSSLEREGSWYLHQGKKTNTMLRGSHPVSGLCFLSGNYSVFLCFIHKWVPFWSLSLYIL